MQAILAFASFSFVSLLLRECIVVCIINVIIKDTMVLVFHLFPGYPTISAASFC